MGMFNSKTVKEALAALGKDGKEIGATLGQDGKEMAKTFGVDATKEIVNAAGPVAVAFVGEKCVSSVGTIVNTTASQSMLSHAGAVQKDIRRIADKAGEAVDIYSDTRAPQLLAAHFTAYPDCDTYVYYPGSRVVAGLRSLGHLRAFDDIGDMIRAARHDRSSGQVAPERKILFLFAGVKGTVLDDVVTISTDIGPCVVMAEKSSDNSPAVRFARHPVVADVSMVRLKNFHVVSNGKVKHTKGCVVFNNAVKVTVPPGSVDVRVTCAGYKQLFTPDVGEVVFRAAAAGFPLPSGGGYIPCVVRIPWVVYDQKATYTLIFTHAGAERTFRLHFDDTQRETEPLSITQKLKLTTSETRYGVELATGEGFASHPPADGLPSVLMVRFIFAAPESNLLSIKINALH
jgi:hypothetical protein